MSHAPARERGPPSLQPSEGWHSKSIASIHAMLAAMTPAEIKDGRATLATILNPGDPRRRPACKRRSSLGTKRTLR